MARLERIAPLSGLVFVVLMIGGFVIIGGVDDRWLPPADEILDFYADNSSSVWIGANLMGVSAFFLIVFASSVSSSMRSGAPAQRLFPGVTVGGGLVAAAMLLAHAAVITSAAQRTWTDGGLTTAAATTLYDLAGVLASQGASIGLAALVGGYTAVSFRHRMLPTWLNWVSAVLVVGMLSPYNWAIGALALPWIAIVSVLIYRRQGGAAQEAG